MESLRAYGEPPYRVIVLHGGPGAAGEMAPVAQELAQDWGVLEPLQTADSLEGQIEGLRSLLVDAADLPVVLVGFSWGAWLAYLFAARYPRLTRKLILIGSGPFEERYVAELHHTRLSRLTEAEQAEIRSLEKVIQDSVTVNGEAAFQRFGALFSKADAYDPVAPGSTDAALDFRVDVYRGVWPEAAAWRRGGILLAVGQRINCPVVAIHGTYDPHPIEGVAEPLSSVLGDFRLVTLERCGHKPWIERHARERFYGVLKDELS
jgi:pimeloyl-ACP methyl ester carboxylesterase